jgi:hypothetical protein
MLNVMCNELQSIFAEASGDIPVSFALITLRPDGESHVVTVNQNFTHKDQMILLLKECLKRARSMPEGGRA